MDALEFTLREWRLEDCDALVRHADNANLHRFVRERFPYPYTPEDGRKFLGFATAQPRPATDLAIEIGGEAAGGVGLVLQKDVERISAEVGYWLGERYWGRGIMTRVVTELAVYAFANFPLQKLYATVFAFNLASMRVLEKAGFAKEGVLRSAAVKDGQITDLHYYGLVKG